VPPIPAIPIHHGLDVSDFRSALLPASWLVPVISFLEISTSETIAEVSPCDVAPPLCGHVVPIPSSMGLSGTEVASSSIVFIFFPLELFLVAQATICVFFKILLRIFFTILLCAGQTQHGTRVGSIQKSVKVGVEGA